MTAGPAGTGDSLDSVKAVTTTPMIITAVTQVPIPPSPSRPLRFPIGPLPSKSVDTRYSPSCWRSGQSPATECFAAEFVRSSNSPRGEDGKRERDYRLLDPGESVGRSNGAGTRKPVSAPDA